MMRTRRIWITGVLLTTLLGAGTAFGQTTTTAQQTTPPPRGQRPPAGRAGRAGVPPITANMKPAELQAVMDTWEVIQARTVLQLSEDQEPNFIARLQRIQAIRRRQMQEHRRIMEELVVLLKATPAAKAEDIDARVKALQDARDTEAADLKKAYLDIDAVLTPWQRGRFRQFEDQVERRKIELLTTIGGGGAPAPTPTPGAGRGRK